MKIRRAAPSFLVAATLFVMIAGCKDAAEAPHQRVHQSSQATSVVSTSSQLLPSARELHSQLTRQGVPPDVTKLTVLAFLERKLDKDLRSIAANDSYWTANSNESERLRLQHQGWAEIRASLVSMFGSGAAHDPAFDRAFRPLQLRFPYLNGEEQIALQEAQRSLALALQGNERELRDRQTAQREFEQVLRRALKPESFTEYQIRESPTARELRQSGVALSEDEFRAVVMARLAARAPDSPRSYAAQETKVRDLLGADRYAQLTAARDPAFGALQETAKREGIDQRALMRAYQVILDGQLSVISLASARQGEPPPSRTIQQLMEQRDRQLSALVGPSTAAALTAAHSQALQRVTQRSGSVGP